MIGTTFFGAFLSLAIWSTSYVSADQPSGVDGYVFDELVKAYESTGGKISIPYGLAQTISMNGLSNIEKRKPFGAEESDISTFYITFPKVHTEFKLHKLVNLWYKKNDIAYDTDNSEFAVYIGVSESGCKLRLLSVQLTNQGLINNVTVNGVPKELDDAVKNTNIVGDSYMAAGKLLKDIENKIQKIVSKFGCGTSRNTSPDILGKMAEN